MTIINPNQPRPKFRPKQQPPHCAFCGRSEGQIPVLITGKEARICNDCIRTAAKQLDDIEAGMKKTIITDAIHH